MLCAGTVYARVRLPSVLWLCCSAVQEDESDEFEDLGIDYDYYYPAIHVYFNDDLTTA